MKAMRFRPLRRVLGLANGGHTRWLVREQMMAATFDDLLEIR